MEFNGLFAISKLIPINVQAVLNEKDEFKGYVTIAYENVQIFNKSKNHYDTLDYIETTYFIWFRYIVWYAKKITKKYFQIQQIVTF